MEKKTLTVKALEAQDSALRQDLEDALANCMKCGNCQAGCPIYKETRLETSVARGKLSLLQGVLNGKLAITGTFDSIMSQCLNCKTCSANCPCGVQADQLILRGRHAAIKARGLHPIKKTVFRLLKHRRLFNLAMRMGGAFGGLTFKKIPGRMAVRSRLPMPGMDSSRATAPLAAVPLRSQYPSDIKPAVSRLKVAFFTGCTINYMYTDMGTAVIDVLRANDMEVIIPAEQHCCATPVHVSGDFELANEMARQTIEVFEACEADYIVGACGSCVEALKEYPVWLADDPVWQKRAQRLAAKVREISEFLVEVGYRKDLMGPVHKTITMHDPCHMVRGIKITEQPREILASIPGVTLVEMKEHDRCCGSGGSFSLSHYDLSRKINDRKCKNIADSHAELVTASCPSCRMHITDGLIQNHMEQIVVHPIQILAESYERGRMGQ